MNDPTRVVHLGDESYDVYIGRGRKDKSGYFGNPFPLHRHTRENAIELYRTWFRKRLRIDPEFARRIRELKGKTLGCYCKPLACHGDVIAEYLNGLEE